MKNINLISFQGEFPLFRAVEISNLKKINQRTFTDTLRDFNCVQSLKFSWEKASDYLAKIIEKKDFKKLRKTILKIAAKDLDFNLQASPAQDLEQKIKNAYKSAKLKPKMNN